MIRYLLALTLTATLITGPADAQAVDKSAKIYSRLAKLAVAATGVSLMQQFSQRGFQGRFLLDDRSVKQCGRRHGLRPHRIGRIHGYKIPENAVTGAALRLRLRGTGILGELGGE